MSIRSILRAHALTAGWLAFAAIASHGALAEGGQELADQLGVPLLGQVPLVESLRAGGDVGRPIVVTDPDNEAARAFVRIAERLDVEVKATRIYHPELRIG